MPRMIFAIPILAGTVALAGCSSIFGSHAFRSQSEEWLPKQRDPQEYAASQIDLGRDGLRYGQYGLAVIAFRNAQRFPKYSAEAHNGLGVAYAEIGRPDVARQYFQLAMQEDPSDKRFAANLQRLDTAVMKDQQQRMAQAGTKTGAAPDNPNTLAVFPSAGDRAGIRVERPGDDMTRVSASEVLVGANSARIADSLGRRRSGASPVEIAAANVVRRRNPQYPIRVEMPPTQINKSVVRVAKRADYPVRVVLGN